MQQDRLNYAAQTQGYRRSKASGTECRVTGQTWGRLPAMLFSENASLFLISALADWKLQRRVKKIIGLSNQVNFFCKKYADQQTQSVNQEPDMNETLTRRNDDTRGTTVQ